MALRVTNSMMANVVNYNVQRAMSRFLDLQENMSTGRRINVPSDDPIGTIRDLDYRSELSNIEIRKSNIEVATNWQQTYDTVLSDTYELLVSAKTTAVTMANGIHDAATREATATEVRSLYDQLLNLANTELGGKTVFSGYRTDADAFVGSGVGAVYQGDEGNIDLEVESNMSLTTNKIGSYVFLSQLSTLGEEADLNVAVTGTTLLSDLNGGDGVDLTEGATPGTFTISDLNLGLTSTVDLNAAPAATTVQDVVDKINAQLATDGINDITAEVNAAGNGLSFTANPSGVITANTALAVLNGGNGIDIGEGRIILSDGINPDIEVDFGEASTIGDLITAFNATAPAGVTMQVEPVDGKALQIVDSNGIPLGLEVLEINENSTTARNLGLLGDIDPTLTGNELDPTISMRIEETSGTTADDLGILADFRSSFVGTDLDPLLTLTADLSDLNSGAGFDWGPITIRHGEIVKTVDLSDPSLVTVQDMVDRLNNLGLDITASINPAGTGLQIVNDDTNRTLTVEDSSPDSNLTKQLGIYGSSDMMGSLLALARALENNDAEGIGLLIENVDLAVEHASLVRAEVGARWNQLEITLSRAEGSELAYTELLSKTEDADITSLVSQLAVYESNYQAALMASSMIIQPSLLDFLD